MNTIDEHLDKARHNLAFLNTVDVAQGAFADWAIVVLFYRALHLVSAVVHAKGQNHGKNHKERQRVVDSIFSHAASESYERLYSRSRELRYEEVWTTAGDFNRLLRSDFEPLLQEVRQHIPSAA